MRAPSASSTSALPDRPVAERLPCLASAQPAPAAMSAAVVETLNVGRPPPVPAVSTRSSRSHGTGVASARIVPRQPGQLVDRLALRAQPDEEGGDLHLGGVAGHDLGQHRGRLLLGQVAARRERVDGPGQGVGRHLSCQEVRQQPLALVGQHRLGMELDALGGQLAVADAHHDAAAAGGDLEAGGDVLVDHQRVVAPDGQRRGQAREDRAAVVLDRRGLAVDGQMADDRAAEGLRERLVAQAHPEGRHAGLREAAHRPRPRCRPRWACTARARRRRGRSSRASSSSTVGAVVAHDLELAAQLAQVLDEVVGERVVVVDDEHAPRGRAHARHCGRSQLRQTGDG